MHRGDHLESAARVCGNRGYIPHVRGVQIVRVGSHSGVTRLVYGSVWVLRLQRVAIECIPVPVPVGETARAGGVTCGGFGAIKTVLGRPFRRSHIIVNRVSSLQAHCASKGGARTATSLISHRSHFTGNTSNVSVVDTIIDGILSDLEIAASFGCFFVDGISVSEEGQILRIGQVRRKVVAQLYAFSFRS